MSIKNTSPEQIASIVEAQHKFFLTGKTRKHDFRREQLQRLQKALKEWSQPICQALWQDLHKSEQEAILTELSIVEGEIKNHLSHLKGWMRAQRRPTPLKMMPSSWSSSSLRLSVSLKGGIMNGMPPAFSTD